MDPTPLRIAYNTLAFPDETLEQATALGSSLGYAGIELRLVDGRLIESSMPAAERARVKQTVAAAGLPIVCVGSSVILTKEGAGPELHRFLELTKEWESPVVRVYGGLLAEDAGARQKQMDAAAAVLEGAIPLARQLGVTIAVETHDAFSASSVVAELLANVQSEWVGAVWDTHHPHRMGESPAQVYDNIGRRTKHVHIKDAVPSAEHKGGWKLVPLGEGEVPVREAIRLLVAGGYTGYLSVEWEKYWHPYIEKAEVVLPHELKVLREWVGAGGG